MTAPESATSNCDAGHGLAGAPGYLPLLAHHGNNSGGSQQTFSTIVADPPWEYPEGFPTQTTVNSEWQPVEIKPLPYPAMSLWEICALPVRKLAAKNCRLWLRTTNRYIRDAFMVMEAWGFTYRQTLVWHKLDGNTGGSVAPNSAEFLLVGVRGNPPCNKRMKSAIHAFAHQRHSQKPKEWLWLIEQTDDGAKLEMFARKKRPGWSSWGNEVASDVSLQTGAVAPAPEEGR